MLIIQLINQKFLGGFTDRGILLIDGVAKATHEGTSEFDFKAKDSDFSKGNQIEILIENMGRSKFANTDLRKGLTVNHEKR